MACTALRSLLCMFLLIYWTDCLPLKKRHFNSNYGLGNVLSGTDLIGYQVDQHMSDSYHEYGLPGYPLTGHVDGLPDYPLTDHAYNEYGLPHYHHHQHQAGHSDTSGNGKSTTTRPTTTTTTDLPTTRQTTTGKPQWLPVHG